MKGKEGPDAERGPWGAPWDVVMNNKKPTFGLHAISVSGTELLKCSAWCFLNVIREIKVS